MKITAFSLRLNNGIIEDLEFSRNDHELTIENLIDFQYSEHNFIRKSNGWNIDKIFVTANCTNDDDTLPYAVSFKKYYSTNDDIILTRGFDIPLSYSIKIEEYEETEYTAFELSKLTHVKSILYGSGSEKLIALANEIGTPPPNRP
jgi:hypothetical protein